MVGRRTNFGLLSTFLLHEAICLVPYCGKKSTLLVKVESQALELASAAGCGVKSETLINKK